MPRIPLSLTAALAACAPSPQEAAMPSATPVDAATARTPVGTSAPAPGAESPAVAQGRRILSTAFVRIGPDGYLTVALRDGQTLVLRDVVMHRKDFCGATATGRHCGDYADVATARPGGGPVPGAPPAVPDATGGANRR